MGESSLNLLGSGDYNTVFGYRAVEFLTSGYNNIAIGSKSGGYISSGRNNISIGSNLEYLIGTPPNFSYYNLENPLQDGDNQFVLANSLFGLDIYDRGNAKYGIRTNNPQQALHVNGGILAESLEVRGTITASEYITASDRRFKKDIQGIKLGLKEVLQLKPSSYYWNTEIERMKSADPTKLQYGFIAQELEQVIPAVVSGDGTGKDYKSVNYEALIPVLTKAIQEQQEMMEKQKEMMEKQQEMIESLKKRIEILEKSGA